MGSHSPRGTAKTPQVVDTCHNGADRKSIMSGSKGGRQRYGLRSTVALKITSAWRLSELKPMPILFPFPLAGIKERKSCSCVPSCCLSAQLCSLNMRVQQMEGFIEGKQTQSKQFSISCGCHENYGYLVFWVVSRIYYGEAAVSCVPQPSPLGSASPWGWGRASPPGGRSLVKREMLNCSCCAGLIKIKPSPLMSAHCNFRHTFLWNWFPCFLLRTHVLQ